MLGVLNRRVHLGKWRRVGQPGALPAHASGQLPSVLLGSTPGEMRWLPGADPKGMIRDLELLLRASQIG